MEVRRRNADGTVTFTPDADFNGVATFSYTVTDGNLVSNTATVMVNVAPVNDAPVAQNDAVTVSEDVPFSSSISLLANDSDVDGDSPTAATPTRRRRTSTASTRWTTPSPTAA
ncbi:cadherin-like domain-containing protein [Pseudomonas stutzeri]|nr:cadherin-like domain-containing protein [Stutzerimonas stutzeri]